MIWTDDDYLAFAIQDAMRGVKVPEAKIRLTEEDRRVLAQAIVERFKLSKIKFELSVPAPFSTH